MAKKLNMVPSKDVEEGTVDESVYNVSGLDVGKYKKAPKPPKAPKAPAPVDPSVQPPGPPAK